MHVGAFSTNGDQERIDRFVTGDYKWIHRRIPEANRVSTEWQ
jgi:hypothetical protein